MSSRRANPLATAIGGVVLLLVRAVALPLRRFHLGRLLRAVSIPRIEEHPLRTTLTVFGVALGVALLVAVATVNQTVLLCLTDTFEELSGKADLELSASSSGFSDDIVDKVRAHPSVAKVSVMLQQVASILHPKANGERIIILGTDLMSEDDAYFRDYDSQSLEAIKRDPIPFLNAPRNILLSRTLARRLGLKLHDKLPLATGTGIQDFEVYGILDGNGVARAFDGAIGVMDYQAMQIAFSRERNVDRLDIALKNGTNLDHASEQLRRALGPGFTVERPSRKGARIGAMLIGVRTALSMASVIALLVGGFLIHSTVTIGIIQRRRELGTLRALGAPHPDLRSLLILEGGLLGSVGAILGVGLGVLISRVLLQATNGLINQTYLQLSATTLHLDPLVLVGSALLGLTCAIVATALATREARACTPAQALRGAPPTPASDLSKISKRDYAALGLLLACVAVLQLPAWGQLPVPAFAATGLVMMAGLLLLPRVTTLQQALVARLRRVLPLEARLASANLSRELGRTTITAGALAVGVAMVTAFGVFIASFSTSIEQWVAQTAPGDLFITNGSAVPGASSRNVPMADVLHDELRALPAVEDVRRVHIIEAPYGGLNVKLVSMDTAVYARHTSIPALGGTFQDAVEGFARGEVALSENFARRFKLSVGENVTLSAQSGAKSFRIAAILVDYTSDIGTVIMDRATYIASFGDERVGTYELYLRKGASPEAVRTLINQRYGSAHNLFVLTNREVRSEIKARVDQVFSLLRALELVALIVATLGMINALLANVADRVREIGILRAVGMTAHKTSRLIITEGLLIGSLGLLGGIAIGFAFGYIILEHINLVSTGWRFPVQIPWLALLELAVLTLTASCLAGLYPARKAAQLVPTEALGYE